MGLALAIDDITLADIENFVTVRSDDEVDPKFDDSPISFATRLARGPRRHPAWDGGRLSQVFGLRRGDQRSST